MEAIVLAAGEGRRLRPVTERWPKAVLPIDGRPVVGTLLRELRLAGTERVWLVTGHLADRVESLVGDGAVFDVDIRYVRQPGPLGSADAVARALAAGAEPPALVSAADTLFRSGDVGRFATLFGEGGADGAIAVRRVPPPGPGRAAVRFRAGVVEQVQDDDPTNPLSGAPLWALTAAVAEWLCCDQEPFELSNTFQAAVDAGARIAAIEIGKTRDLTDPVDLVEENFAYLTS
jgi:NDP-sugar pyrophosphorylase family protein